MSKPPEWTSQKVWDLYEKYNEASLKQSGQIPTESPTRILRRNSTMAARRLMDGIGEHLGLKDRTTPEGRQQVIDFWNRLSNEKIRRDRSSSD